MKDPLDFGFDFDTDMDHLDQTTQNIKTSAMAHFGKYGFETSLRFSGPE